MTRTWNLGILLQSIVVFIDQLAAKLKGILGRSLPKERCKVIVERSFTATLEINEVGVALIIKHNVAGLEVTIEKTIPHFSCQVLGKHMEIGFKFQLMEIESGSFQEAIFEIIKVEQHTFLIKLGLRIAVIPIKTTGTPYLEIRQSTDCSYEQLLFILIVTSSCFTSSLNGIKQRCMSQISLQIT